MRLEFKDTVSVPYDSQVVILLCTGQLLRYPKVVWEFSSMTQAGLTDRFLHDCKMVWLWRQLKLLDHRSEATAQLYC